MEHRKPVPIQKSENTIFTPFPNPQSVTVRDRKGFTQDNLEFAMPFYYDAVSFFWNYFRVPADRIQEHLEGTGLTAARFRDLGGDGIVSLNFQNYLSNMGMALSTVVEVEFNLHCFPTCKAQETPTVTFEDYVLGQEQTKWIGGFRLHVPASDEIAVAAGRTVFGERKFLAQFEFDIPVPNNPVKADKMWPWSYTTHDPDGEIIYKLCARLNHLGRPVLSNPSPRTLYSSVQLGKDGKPIGPDDPGKGNGRLNASRWNIFGLDKTWFIDIENKSETQWTQKGKKEKHDTVVIEYGKSVHPMREDMEQLIGHAPACAVRFFQSAPSAVENRALWVDEQ